MPPKSSSSKAEKVIKAKDLKGGARSAVPPPSLRKGDKSVTPLTQDSGQGSALTPGAASSLFGT